MGELCMIKNQGSKGHLHFILLLWCDLICLLCIFCPPLFIKHLVLIFVTCRKKDGMNKRSKRGPSTCWIWKACKYCRKWEEGERACRNQKACSFGRKQESHWESSFITTIEEKEKGCVLLIAYIQCTSHCSQVLCITFHTYLCFFPRQIDAQLKFQMEDVTCVLNQG